MEQIINQIAALLTQGISAIVQFLQLVWKWSFGEIINILQSNFQTLQLWEQILLVVAILAIAYIIYMVGKRIWESIVGLFKAFIDLITALFKVSPLIVIAGIIAFAASYAIKNL
ncbi:MAG: hypothetical protein AAFR90_10155 [Pseudomonadota bacterium]